VAFSPFVNYGEHPAFKNFPSKNADGKFDGFQHFKKIDGYFKDAVSNPSGAHPYFDKFIEPEIAQISKLIHDTMSESDILKLPALKSLNNLFTVLKGEVQFLTEGKLYTPSEMSSELTSKGFAVKNLDQDKILELWREIEPWRRSLMEKRNKRPQEMASCVVPLPQEGQKWKVICELLEESGVRPAINHSSRYPMDLEYAALQLSHEDEQWWKNCYEDLGITTSQGSYLHFDQDYNLIKAILYLKPVKISNGPFSVIPNSERFVPSYSREAFFKRLDAEIQPLYLEDPEETSAYYRKHFKLQKFRKEFVKLPSVLQGTSHFGDDLLESSPVAQELLKNEQKIIGDLGQFVVFRGGKILHRGGMVEKGERWAIQFGFRMRDSSWKGLKTRVKGRIKAGLPEDLVKIIRNSKSKLK